VVPTPKIHACVSVFGRFDPAKSDYTRFDPAELDELVGVSARIGRKGDRVKHRADDIRLEHDFWHYSTTPEISYEWPEHLDRLITLLDPVLGRFVEFCDRHDLDREVHLVAEVPEDAKAPNGPLSVDHIAWIATLGAELDIDT
jgi:hypothetical protein